MWKILPVLTLSVFVAAITPAQGEVDDRVLGNLTKRAWGCGNVSQIIEVLRIEDHYPNFRERFVNYTKSRGAAGWQLDALQAVFEVGIQNAIDEGFTVGPEILEEDQQYAIEGFDKRIHECWGLFPKP